MADEFEVLCGRPGVGRAALCGILAGLLAIGLWLVLRTPQGPDVTGAVAELPARQVVGVWAQRDDDPTLPSWRKRRRDIPPWRLVLSPDQTFYMDSPFGSSWQRGTWRLAGSAIELRIEQADGQPAAQVQYEAWDRLELAPDGSLTMSAWSGWKVNPHVRFVQMP